MLIRNGEEMLTSPDDFNYRIFRATIVGGIGTILGAIIGGIVFGILAALLVAGLGAVFQTPSCSSSNEISVLLASISGFGGALWGAGIGGVAGLLTGILLVVLEPERPAKTVHIRSR
jgi:site-specific recombinase